MLLQFSNISNFALVLLPFSKMSNLLLEYCYYLVTWLSILSVVSNSTQITHVTKQFQLQFSNMSTITWVLLVNCNST